MFGYRRADMMTDEEVMALFQTDKQGLEIMVNLHEVVPVTDNPRRYDRKQVLEYKAEIQRRHTAFRNLMEMMEEDRTPKVFEAK